MKIIEQHIELLVGLFRTFGNEIDFSPRFCSQIKGALKIAIKKNQWKWFSLVYKQLPKVYRIPFRKSILLKSLKALVLRR